VGRRFERWWKRDQGPTDIANLPSVCDHEHHLIHDKGWNIQRLDDGTWRHEVVTIGRPGEPIEEGL